MNLQYTLTPTDIQGAVGYQLTGPGVDDLIQVLGTHIAHLGDQIVRAQLIAAGWTPPGELAAVKRKDALLRQALKAMKDFDYDKRLAAIDAITKELSQ